MIFCAYKPAENYVKKFINSKENFRFYSTILELDIYLNFHSITWMQYSIKSIIIKISIHFPFIEYLILHGLLILMV